MTAVPHAPPEVLAPVLLEQAELLLIAADIRAGADPAHAVRRWCDAPTTAPRPQGTPA